MEVELPKSNENINEIKQNEYDDIFGSWVGMESSNFLCNKKEAKSIDEEIG